MSMVSPLEGVGQNPTVREIWPLESCVSKKLISKAIVGVVDLYNIQGLKKGSSTTFGRFFTVGRAKGKYWVAILL